MERTSLKYLIEKLIDGGITPSEYVSLKNEINEADNKKIAPLLFGLWETIDFQYKMDDKTRLEIINNIAGITNAMAKQETTRRRLPWKYIVAAAIPICIICGFLLHMLSFRTDPRQFKIITDSGQKTQLVLPDSSRVMLNSVSQLVYSSDYNYNARKVELEGEAFFDVSKSKNKKFIVSLGDIEVEVKGTKFNVEAYKKENTIGISLLEGKVTVNNAKTHKPLIEINPNEKVTYNKNSNQWELKSVNSELDCLWTQNTLRFEGASYEIVIEKLERWFGMKITVDTPPAYPLRYGFTIKHESLEETLRLIDRISPIKYNINGEEVHLIYR